MCKSAFFTFKTLGSSLTGIIMIILLVPSFSAFLDKLFPIQSITMACLSVLGWAGGGICSAWVPVWPGGNWWLPFKPFSQCQHQFVPFASHQSSLGWWEMISGRSLPDWIKIGPKVTGPRENGQCDHRTLVLQQSKPTVPRYKLLLCIFLEIFVFFWPTFAI